MITGEQVGGLFVAQQASLGTYFPEFLQWNVFDESFVSFHPTSSLFRFRIFTETLRGFKIGRNRSYTKLHQSVRAESASRRWP